MKWKVLFREASVIINESTGDHIAQMLDPDPKKAKVIAAAPELKLRLQQTQITLRAFLDGNNLSMELRKHLQKLYDNNEKTLKDT
jgi:hypothetical protein